MCLCPSRLSLCPPLYYVVYRKGNDLCYRRIYRRRRSSKRKMERRMAVVKAEMEIKNLKLYMENKSIIEQNEKLRKQAITLCQENQELLCQLQNKFSKDKNNNH